MAGKKDDVHFVGCLKAIQKHYVHFPKTARLRVEAWVQKIAAASGSGNDSFLLHRNRYARLLMHQCMRRVLSDPFDRPPPDGLLPAFPSHLRSKLKDVVDPQDVAFWTDIFDSLQQSKDCADDGDDNDDEATSSSLTHRFIREDCSAEVVHQGAEQMRKLQEVIQTQEHRIASLVKQMESDRAAFQLALQRQEQKYKAQLSRLESTLKEISRMSVKVKSEADTNGAAVEVESLLFTPVPEVPRSRNRYPDALDLSSSVHRPHATSTPNVTRSMSDGEFLQYLNQFQQDLRSDSSDLLL